MGKKRSREEIEQRKQAKSEYWKKQAEDVAAAKVAFAAWKTANGLDEDAYDVARHGEIDDRCEEDVLWALFHANYVRPVSWNSSDCYFEITLVTQEDGIHTHYVRCDHLTPAQFDHLNAIKLGVDDEDMNIRQRVEYWFLQEDDATIDRMQENPPEGCSHPLEIGEFNKSFTVSTETTPRIIVDAGRSIPLDVLHAGFSVAFYTTLDVEGN